MKLIYAGIAVEASQKFSIVGKPEVLEITGFLMPCIMDSDGVVKTLDQVQPDIVVDHS